MLRIFLNNNQVEFGVLGLGDVVEDLELSTSLHGYLYQVQGSISFVLYDYDYLRGLFDAGYCEDVAVDVQYSADFGGLWTSKIKALIKLAGVKWDRIKRIAECPIVDNSYQSKINNNRQIVFQLGDHSGTVLSKNGVDVSSKVVFHSEVQLFAPFRGRYFVGEALYNKSNPPFPSSEGNDLVDLQPQPRVGMFIWDALNLLVAMMTDDEVDFASDYLSYDLGDMAGTRDEAFVMMMTGGHLRSGSTYPKLNFEQTFNDLHKLNNLWFSMEYTTGGKPRIRVEDEDYFRQANSGTYFNSVKSLIESIDLTKIYSRVIVGCSTSSSGNFPVGSIPLVNHVQEEFPLAGTCNTSNDLDLRLEKLIINTNSIAEALPSIVGFSTGSLVKRKFTNGDTTAAPNQQITDSAGEFKETLVQQKFLIRNTVTGEWSYITGVPDGSNILVWDEIFTPDTGGATKEYEIYKPSEDTKFRDEVFLIQMDRDHYDEFETFKAKQSLIDPPGDLYYYNETFANYKVIERHMGGVAQSIVNSLSDGNDEFLAQQSSNHILNDASYFQTVPNAQYRRIRFDDDINAPNFDTNGNYDPLTGIYTAPQGGYYHAYCSVRFTNGHIGNEDFIQQVELCRVSATGDVIESESGLTTITEPSSFTFTLDRVFYLQEGETIQVFVKKPFGTTGIYLNQYIPFSEFNGGGSFGEGYGIIADTDLTFFGVDFLFNGGGVVPASDPEEVRLLNFEAELSVDRQTFDSVLENPFKYYHTNFSPSTENPHYQTGYIGKISRGILNGECTMTKFKKIDGV
jgi:hypothetical protein